MLLMMMRGPKCGSQNVPTWLQKAPWQTKQTLPKPGGMGRIIYIYIYILLPFGFVPRKLSISEWHIFCVLNNNASGHSCFLRCWSTVQRPDEIEWFTSLHVEWLHDCNANNHSKTWLCHQWLEPKQVWEYREEQRRIHPPRAK